MGQELGLIPQEKTQVLLSLCRKKKIRSTAATKNSLEENGKTKGAFNAGTKA